MMDFLHGGKPPGELPAGDLVQEGDDETTTMSYDEVHAILDRVRFGDTLTVVRTNGGNLTSTVSGPVICAPGISQAVGIDLLDGDPHIVREHDGDIWGAFLRVELTKGEPR